MNFYEPRRASLWYPIQSNPIPNQHHIPMQSHPIPCPQPQSPINSHVSSLKILKIIIPPRTQLPSPRLPLLLLIRIIIEIPRIPGILHDRNNRTLIFPIIYIFPNDAVEEGVFFHSRRAAGCVAEAEGPVDGAEFSD